MNAMPRIALTAASFFFFGYDAYAQQAAQEKTGTIAKSVQAANNPPRTMAPCAVSHKCYTSVPLDSSRCLPD